MYPSLNTDPIVYSPTSIRINRGDKHLLTSLQRKCYFRQIDDGKQIPNNLLQLLSDLSQKTSQPPLYNFSLLNYCRKKINLQLVQPSDFPSFIHEIKPRQLQLLNGKSAVDITRGQSEFQRTQAYEVVRPFVVFGRNQKLVDCMLPAITALANEQDGGFIIIAEAYSGSVVKTGFPPLNLKLVEQVLQKSLKRIYHNQSIHLKAEALPIHQDFKAVLDEKKPKQFVIRVTVMVRPDTRDFFWVTNKTADSKQDCYTFFSIDSVKQPCDELFRVSQVKDHQIYHLMQNVAMKRIKSREFITKNKNFTSGIVLQLHMQAKTLENREPSSNPFLTILIQLSETDVQQALQDLKNLKCRQLAVQVQISQRLDISKTLQPITKLLDEKKEQYQYIMPLKDFQIKRQKPKEIGSFIYYFFLNKKFDEFQGYIQEIFTNQQEGTVVMTQVKSQVSLKSWMNINEMLDIRNFLWRFFNLKPKQKKKTQTSSLTFSDIKFIFTEDNFHIAIFTSFILTLGQKNSSVV